MNKPTKKSKSSKRAKNEKPSRVPVPWEKIRKLWESGASYEAISKATDPHYDSKKPDPTKSTRAKVSRAKTVGVVIGGKVVRFKPRSRKEFKKPAKASKSVRPQKKAQKRTNPSLPTPKPSTPVEPPALETDKK